MHFKGMLSLCGAIVAAIALVSASGATTAKTHKIVRIDVSSRASIVHYLRSIHVNPKGVVIQRGVRNYAGPACPGKGWRCARTLHAVVQIAWPGGMNRFRCTMARCAVVQVAAAAAKPNKAVCIRTTGLTQSCVISQSSATNDNMAAVYENAGTIRGLTQTASYTASITQQATGSSNKNIACVYQATSIDGSTVARRGTPVNVNLASYQSVTITQDSVGGGNQAQQSSDATGACTGSAITQNQTLTSTATGSGPITQNENAPDNGTNMTLDIEQNQSPGFVGSAHGQNFAILTQTNTLSAIANTPVGSVSQTQSSPSGGILAKVNQDSRDKSTANATQTETQCEDAATGSLTECATGSPDTLPFTLTQVQYGPEGVWKTPKSRGRQFYSVKKAPGDSTQTGNTDDSFTVTQSSRQDSDAGSSQTNVVQGGLHTDGNGTVTQNTNVNGTTNSNTQSGQDISTQTTCFGSICFTSGDVFVSIGDGLVQERSPAGVLVRTLDTGKGSGVFTTGLAFDPSGRLYVTDFNANDVSRISNDGSFGSFGSGYNANPESIVFDSNGNAYVGQADGSHSVLKFSPLGALLATFSPTTELRGTDWIELAPDQCTLYYTSEGTSVKRFNVCTNGQLSDFATGLPGPGEAFALKLLPGGGALVADDDSIVRLDSTGNVVQHYGTGESASGAWFSLALDPSGTAFWAGDIFTGVVTKFDLSTGGVLATFTTGGAANGAAAGLAVAP